MSEGPSDVPTRRPQCARCLRPASACICGWIRPIGNQIEVLILQHPLEVTQAKGSAKLLQLSLAHCELLIGETLDEALLAASLHRPTADGRLARPVLLYPDTPGLGRHAPPVPLHMAAAIAAQAAPGSVPPSGDGNTAPRLVVIDGTWRKSLKMLHANPLLQGLPRLALDAKAPSRYLIRKAPKPGQLSTLEATCMALSGLEADASSYAMLLEAFDGFILANRSSSERHTTRLRPPRLAS